MIISFLILLGILNVIDMVTTYIGMDNGAEEFNPVLKYLFSKIGVIPSLVIDKTLRLILVYWMCTAHWFEPMTTLCILIFLVAIYLGVIVNNFEILKELSIED